MTPTIFQTEIIEHSGLKYRCQLREVHGGWEQRHIWFPAQSTYVDTPTASDWIWHGREGDTSKMTATEFPNADLIQIAA